jgi:sec-independent protein translocase protein TatA
MGLDNPIHIAFLLIVLLVVFGAKRLPEMGRSLGSGMRGFRDALSSDAAPVALSEVHVPAEPVTAPAAVPAEAHVVATAAPAGERVAA